MPRNTFDDADQSRRFLDAAQEQMEDEAISVEESRPRFEATVGAAGLIPGKTILAAIHPLREDALIERLREEQRQLEKDGDLGPKAGPGSAEDQF